MPVDSVRSADGDPGPASDWHQVPPPGPPGSEVAPSFVYDPTQSWQQWDNSGGFQPEAPHATVTLVLGIIGLVPLFMTVLLAPVAMILGFIGRSKVRASPPGTYANTSRLDAGWILGIFGTVLLILYAVAVAIAIYVMGTHELE